MTNGHLRSSPLDTPGSADSLIATEPTGSALWRRRIRHDIRHELGTIILLASAVTVSDDIGPTSRRRIDQLLGETRWIDHLLRQLDEGDAPPDEGVTAAPERVRVDNLADEVIAGVRLATTCDIRLAAEPAWAHVNVVSLWRALRNVLGNACRLAAGQIHVRVLPAQGWITVQVDDDGPGFGTGPEGLNSLGLGIVHDLVSGYGGSLEIRTSHLGGAQVRILLPEAPPPGGGTVRGTGKARQR